MSKKYGFGIVGCGVISKWHISAAELIPNAKLIGVFDNRKESAEKVAAEHSCRVFDTFEDMLACSDIDIISICTPSGLHAPLAIKAANAGKNIICEKPMAITHEQIDELIAAVENNHVKMAVISQLRFTESVQKVKKAIDNGELGKILVGDVYMKYYRSPEYYASSAWRGTWAMDGGGALMNQGIHGVDVLQYLVGPVKSVYGRCKTLARDIEVEDTATVVVEYESGAIGVIEGTTSVNPGYPRIIEIHGTRGTICLTEDEITEWNVDGVDLLSEKSGGGGKVKSFRDPTAIDLDNHRRQIEEFIDAVKEDKRPLVDVYEGKKPVEIILAAYESSKTGCKIEL